MKPPTAIQILIIGLVVAFAAGYLVGGRGQTIQVAPLVNYNPAAGVCADAIDKANAATERCWQTVIAEIDRRVHCAQPAPSKEVP